LGVGIRLVFGVGGTTHGAVRKRGEEFDHGEMISRSNFLSAQGVVIILAYFEKVNIPR
jgi:hypothetical protein